MAIKASRPKGNTHTRYNTGQKVPRSGSYRTFHKHALASEIPLLKNVFFRACPACRVPVQFELVSAVTVESAGARFRLLMQTQRNESV